MTSEVFVDAVKRIATEFSDADRYIIETFFSSPAHSATAGEIANKINKDVVVINSAVSRFGKNIVKFLGGYPEGVSELDIDYGRPYHVVAIGMNVDGRGFIWKMREEVVAGLRASGFREKPSVLNIQNSTQDTSEEFVDESTFQEGKVHQVTVNKYERNFAAREKCLQIHGTACAVCDFDFGRVYGDDAAGFIHVHHVVPVSSRSEEYVVNPAKDIIPVCPNCHAVIHMSEPPFALEKVKELIQLAKTKRQTVLQKE